jgi:hypothetical protein
MTSVLGFGERLDGYPVPVLNERAVRAAAGILFLFAMVAFMNAWLLGNFQPTRVFVVAFLIDFTLRLFFNPRFAPSLIAGQWLVRKLQPEWTGAPQKRFAWAIGFVLASVMFWLVVVQQVVGPVNILVCALCLTLLFFESAFGICLGCKIYEWVVRKPPELCPGGVCAFEPDPRVQPGLAQGVVAAVYLVAVGGIWQAVYHHGHDPQASAATAQASPATAPVDPAEAERCKVPEFAKVIGHEEMWKLHNNCK